MLSPFSQFFKKNGEDSSAEPASNEDLECGHGLLIPQTRTASGYQSSPGRVYLPETQTVHALTVPQTPAPSRDYFSHVQYNGQHGSAAQVPLTPSGPSKVVGYLPRTVYSGSPPFISPTRLIMPSQPFQKVSKSDLINNSGPQGRSFSISSIASQSPRSPFDPGKHGQALRRLETHGSLKTIPSSQQEGPALNRTSVSWSEFGREVFEEDHAAGLRGSHPQQPETRTPADPYETADEQLEADLSPPPISYVPNSSYQPAVFSQGDSSEVVNLPDPPTTEGGQSLKEALASFVLPLPNAEAENSDQFTQQALHRSQVPAKRNRALSSKSLPGETIAADASPDLRFKNSSFEVMPENDTIRSFVRSQGSENFEDMSAYEAEGEEGQQRPIVNPISKCAHPTHTFVQIPNSEEIDEYLWSPAPSDDGQEASLAPHTPVPHHAPSDALRASPISRITSDSHGGFSRSLDSHGNERIESMSDPLGNPRVIDSPLPHIDVLIPAGDIDLDSHSDFLISSQHASTMGSRGSSGILFRYSGVITDGASSRPMSETELREEVLHSLGDRAETGLSMLNSRDSSSQTNHNITKSDQIRGEHKPNVRPEAFPLDRVQNPSANAGPGSSQTSSSLSTDHYGSNPSGHKACLELHELPSSRTRCPTPPLLFGKYAISNPEKSDVKSKPALGNNFSRFDSNAKAVRLKESSRLPTASCSLGELDWETVSAETEADTHIHDGTAFDTKTGSSLADNSDSDSLSLSKETLYPFRGIKARPVMQHPTLPRHNHSFMLLKNSQTGDLVQVPQYEYASRGRLLNNNASAQLVSSVRADSTYQHPSPLRTEHSHPFTSSPPIIRSAKPSAISIDDSCVVMQQNHQNSELSSLRLSESIQEVKGTQAQNLLYKTTQDVSRVRDPVVDQNQHVMKSKEQSRQSSAWLSTVSEVASSEPSLPGNGGTFAKMVTWDGKSNVNGTPGQGGNEEVGSSLADASSPGANFSSSPAPLASSPTHFSDTPPLVGQGFHTQADRHNLDYGSEHLLGDFNKSLARSFNRQDSATSTTNTEDRSRSHSASGLRLKHRNPSPRRRRSSSESQSRLMDSPSAQKASALNLSSSDGHAQQTSSFGILLRNPYLHSDDNDFRNNPNQHNVIDRRGRQPKADDASLDESNTPSSTESRPFVRDGVVHTDAAPPVLHHPVYGRDRPWDRVRPDCPRPRPQPHPLGRPLFQRPVARAESPHLHRVPHPTTPELLERHVLLSQVYLVLSMVIPPISLIYGHGYMDGLMRFHTEGQINDFRSTEKTIALCWGYGVSAICILAIVIAMITISASG
ncbi:MAG: hypothetical protein Q9175_000054 [Cornicularia normoerica]